MLRGSDLPGDLGKEMRLLFLQVQELRDHADMILKTYAPESKDLRVTREQRVEAAHALLRRGETISRMAEALGVSRFTVHRLLKQACVVETCKCRELNASD